MRSGGTTSVGSNGVSVTAERRVGDASELAGRRRNEIVRRAGMPPKGAVRSERGRERQNPKPAAGPHSAAGVLAGRVWATASGTGATRRRGAGSAFTSDSSSAEPKGRAWTRSSAAQSRAVGSIAPRVSAIATAAPTSSSAKLASARAATRARTSGGWFSHFGVRRNGRLRVKMPCQTARATV